LKSPDSVKFGDYNHSFQLPNTWAESYACTVSVEMSGLFKHPLKKAGCRRIFQEKISGSNRNRPEFRRMLDHLREGDIIVVWKLDRLARSTRDLLETMETIREAEGRFQSISEPWADTTSHSGKMIMTIFAGIADDAERAIMQSHSAEVAMWPACR
jgi:DNA invertase Pin-like site-specific DNA recombinase